MADAVVEGGWRDAGYVYISVDDCAFTGRNARGELIADPKRFTNGTLAALAAYVHARGLRLGSYLDFGNHTCAYGHNASSGKGEYPAGPGSYGHVQTDVATLARWGVDHVKVDACYRPSSNAEYYGGFAELAEAVDASGREMWLACSTMSYSEHEGCTGVPNPCSKNFSAGGAERVAAYRKLLKPGGCNSITVKLDDYAGFYPSSPPEASGLDGSISAFIDFFGDNQEVLAAAAGPGHFNDPESILAGTSGQWLCDLHPENCVPGARRPFVLNPAQTQAQLVMYALWAVPLILGFDVRAANGPEHTGLRALLQNPELLGVNQDELGQQGRRLRSTPAGRSTLEVWTKPLHGGDLAVALLNHCRRTQTDAPCSETHAVSAPLASLGLGGWGAAHVRDLLRRADRPSVARGGSLSTHLPPEGVALFRLRRSESEDGRGL